jgi:hypothetical protein
MAYQGAAMSNDKDNEYSGEFLSADVARKQIIEIGNINRVPPEVGIFDDPIRCFKINQQWWSIVAGMVHWLADVAAWQDAEDDSYFAIKAIQQFMQGVECAAGSEPMLRQNPDDSCILQQSLDNGETWTDVFDFSLCATIQDKSYQVQIQNEVTYVQPTFQEIYNSYTTNYAGTPESVYPDLADPAGDDAPWRSAYCNALWELVNTACDTAVSFYTENINATQSQVNLGIGIAAFLLTAISLAGAIPTAGASLAGLAAVAPLWAAGIGLGAALGNALVDFWQNHTIDQFQDTNARENVVCYLFDAIPPESNTLDEMRLRVSTVLTGDTNGQAILDFLGLLLNHDSTYAAFLEKWNNNKEFAEAGIDLYCPCYEPEWRIKVYDFTQQRWDSEIDPYSGTAGFGGKGTYVPGKGWEASYLTAFPTQRISVRIPVDPTHRIRSFAFKCSNGITVNGSTAFHIRPEWDSLANHNPFVVNGGTGEYKFCRGTPFNLTGQTTVSIHVGEPHQDFHVYLEKLALIYFPDESPSSTIVSNEDSLC